METVAQYLDTEQLEQGMADVQASPADAGPLEAIFLRPQPDKRQQVTTAQISVEGGLAGDRWSEELAPELPDDSPYWKSQVSLMNARILRLVAGQPGAMGLAGDNLIVDLDLSENNLPAGSRLRIGEVELELTDLSHTGCGRFSHRYGKEAVQLINGPLGKRLNLRGRYARVLAGGTVRVGDAARKA